MCSYTTIWNFWRFYSLVTILQSIQAARPPSPHIPEEFEIVVPHVFHEENRRISISEVSSASRSKRSVSEDLFINITSQQETFHIKLSRNTHLLSPRFKIYHRHSIQNYTDTSEDDVINQSSDITGSDVDSLSKCLFHGHVTSHNMTRAAISVCRGITGVLMFPHDDYVIEPLPVHMKNPDDADDPDMHIMYKRSSLALHKLQNYEGSNHHHIKTKSSPQFHRARRKRNQRSVERSVETLVVLDRDMYQKHGRENVTTYVLSIFNIVSQLYQEPSLGYPISIVLVGLVYLDGREPGLHISHHADKTLNSFCQWQAGVHNGRRKLHDHAVLLTGKDICSYQNAPCDTLGFAPIEGMCSELRSCIVNEDTGLSTAFTVAHELGHNFGMLHDGDGNNCRQTTGNIMSPTLSAQSGTFHWSTCSRQYMRKYLNTAASECLTSQTRGTAELKFPDKQPGEIFDADTQCKWQFGSHSKQCTFLFGRDPCKNLWCFKRSGMCETKFLPAAEGTSCGHGMWCQQGRCVSYGKKGPPPIHGWWTDWSAWSHCSRTCGGGVKTRTRECNNPRPQYGGRTCDGEESMHQMCNLQSCERTNIDFREEQCRARNQHTPRNNLKRKWRPSSRREPVDGDDQCKLVCRAEGYRYYYNAPFDVMDGTRCNDHSTDICVQGQCRAVGCDLVVGSSAQRDRCGACRGDNSTCKIVEDVFTAQPRKNTYAAVVYIPRGSTSISIEEVRMSPSNYLALRSNNGRYHLNGNWHLDPEGVYTIGGNKFIYRRPYNRPESLAADGPLTVDLVLEILVQARNPGIQYSFAVPRSSNRLPPPQYNLTWTVIITDCTEACAGGEQIITAHCHREPGGEVDPAYCDQDKKPGTGKYPCNTDPCPPRWVAEPWSVCHKSCGGGQQKRRVYCIQKLSKSEDRRIPKKYCDADSRPDRRRECNTHECPPVWFKGAWSKCSKTCGKGVKSRTVVCRSKTSMGQLVLPDSMCRSGKKPASHKGCRKRKCPDPTAQWVVTSWLLCSVSCGEGVQKRAMKCSRKTQSGKSVVIRDKHCSHLSRNNLTLEQPCAPSDCPSNDAPKWYASPWSKCSASCGAAYQTRLVHCIHEQQKKLARDCDPKNKPSESQPCLLESCPSPDPKCKDHFTWCQLVPKHNICKHPFYGSKCCSSCKS